jgi:adenosylhomocysteine nucleosidase
LIGGFEMTIGIIAAMEEELKKLIDLSDIEKKECKAGMEFNCGKLYNFEIVAVISGIGKVNAAICTQILADDFNVDAIINIGVAGGINKDVFPGDIVIADTLVQHDMDTSVFGDKVGQVPRLNTFDFKCDKNLISKAVKASEGINDHKCFIGRIVSGDQFIASPEKLRWLENKFNAFACEMEGASIAQVCYLNNIPFIIIRSISDNANNGAHIDYEKFKTIAVKNSTEILCRMLRSM